MTIRRGPLTTVILVLTLTWIAMTGRAQEPPAIISVVGTGDLHGHVLPRDGRGGVALLGGYLRNLRAARARDRGAVLLLDAGDMFQGTLESNLTEGAVVISAYNALGYAAAAIGNHEFDFGPAGDAPTPRAPADDPRGALKDRAAEARFPLLAANIIDAASGLPVAWPNVRPSAIVEAAGVKVGIVGVTTSATLRSTIAANVVGLKIAPLDQTIAAEAVKLRAAGAGIVVVAAHAGASCSRLDDPEDLSSCRADAEILDVARQLPRGAVDAIVAGHMHAAVAHEVAGIPIIESFSNGRAFGRVDLTVDRTTGRKLAHRLFPPRDVCGAVDPATLRCDRPAPGAVRVAARYEDAEVRPDEAIETLIVPAVERAKAMKETRLGVVLNGPIRRSVGRESALGNLVADLMRDAVAGADIALTNGGGLRADLPAGPLTYGALYEALPFDNLLARLELTGGELAHVLAHNLQRTSGILSISGVTVQARCIGEALAVSLFRSGVRVADQEPLTVITSDFLATGGDGALMAVAAMREVTILEDMPVRDAVAQRLRQGGGRIDPDRFFRSEQRRLTYPGERPVKCGT